MAAVSVTLGSITIIARFGSATMALSVVRACEKPWETRVLAYEEGDLAVLEVASQRCSEHLAHHQHLAGLLLRDGVRPEPGPERSQGRRAVRATEVVPLAAPAVVDDGLASIRVAHRGRRAATSPMAVSQSISS